MREILKWEKLLYVIPSPDSPIANDGKHHAWSNEAIIGQVFITKLLSVSHFMFMYNYVDIRLLHHI